MLLGTLANAGISGSKAGSNLKTSFINLNNAGLLAEGSKGQAVINPLIQLTLKLEEKILRLEQELGLTPLARQRLGIAFGEAQMGFQQLQQLLQEDNKQNNLSGM